MKEQHNPITGHYEEVEDDSVEKNKGTKWPSFSGDAEDNEDDDSEEFEKRVPIFPIEKSGDEHICAGIVYEPDVVDAQGDSASAEEIKKAAYGFMEHAQQFKVMHRGKPAKIKVLESYIAPTDLTISKREIKKGSWVLVTRILDEKVWALIKAAKLTGFSMAGLAKVD